MIYILLVLFSAVCIVIGIALSTSRHLKVVTASAIGVWLFTATIVWAPDYSQGGMALLFALPFVAATYGTGLMVITAWILKVFNRARSSF